MAEPRPIALVTGARRGIGRAIALGLAQSGFDVAINDLAPSAELDAAVAEATAQGVRAAAVSGDISRPEDHAAMLDAAEQSLGPLTTLVNNAGVSVMSRGDLLEVSEASYDRCQSVNTRGT
jgi:NAD(P)-dependent dehydrogenase (short-subunit alcohol dehydrogenase family)